MSHRFNSFLSPPILILVLCLAMGGLAAPAAGLEVTIIDGSDILLGVGDDLIVTWGPKLPDDPTRVVLEDEVGHPVAEVWAVPNPNALPKVLVWNNTGIVGCDEDAVPSADDYSYARVEDAEADLKQRTFRLITFNQEGIKEAEIKITFEISLEGHAFFSDETGCPRCVYAPFEPIYFARYGDFPVPWSFFLVEGPAWAPIDPFPVGHDIEDVRSAHATFPQTIDGHGLSVFSYNEQVAPGCEMVPALSYWAITRPAAADPDPKVMQGDRTIGASFCPNMPTGTMFFGSSGNSGVVVRNWDKDDPGSSCPPPN